MQDGPAAFGPVLRRLRLAARLSQEELAERAQLSVVSISALERGRRRAPYRATLQLLGDALQLSDGQRHELESAAAPGKISAADAAADVEPAPAGVPDAGKRQRPTNVPAQRTRLVGRDADVAVVTGLLREHRLVTLVGTGGIGKTRTALAAGAALLDHTPGGVWFVDLAPLTRGSYVAAALGRALGIAESPERPVADGITAHLKHKDTLLIFDNCEHVIADAAALADDLLQRCAHVKILATSRERLRLSGEQSYRLPPLALPSPDEAARLRAVDANRYAALALFAERAQSVDRGFTFTDENAPAVAQICRLLDGIALAIELAAARVNIATPQLLLERLGERFRLLTDGDRAALPRHQTLRALLDWSYDLLTPREQRLFERLSVFAGGCAASEAASVCGDGDDDELAVLDGLMSLVDKSLVHSEPAAGDVRFRLLESARMYAAGKLVESGAATRIAGEHARAYLQLAERLERERGIAPDAEWLGRVEPELENWRTALAWSFAADGDLTLGLRLAGALRPVWLSEGTAEGRRWLALALQRAGPATAPEIRAKLQFGATNIAFLTGEDAAALAGARELIEQYGALGATVETAYAEYFAGGSLVSMGRMSDGEPLLARALETAREHGDLWLMGLVLDELAYGKALDDDHVRARAYLAEALDIWTALGAKRNAANGAATLAELLFQAGEREPAIRLATQTIGQLRELKHTRSLIYALNNLAAYRIAGDRWTEARAAAHEALALAQETESNVALAWSLHHLAVAAAVAAADTAACQVAGRLLGFVNARLAALGSRRTPPEQHDYDRARAALDRVLGSSAVELLLAGGTAMTQARAVELGGSL